MRLAIEEMESPTWITTTSTVANKASKGLAKTGRGRRPGLDRRG